MCDYCGVNAGESKYHPGTCGSCGAPTTYSRREEQFDLEQQQLLYKAQIQQMAMAHTEIRTSAVPQTVEGNMLFAPLGELSGQMISDPLGFAYPFQAWFSRTAKAWNDRRAAS